jgi:selenocysteine lyase/cysteine desulfurase
MHVAPMNPAPAYDIEAVRRNLPLLAEWTYLATGTLGLTAEPVLSTHLDQIAAMARGGATANTAGADAAEQCRIAMARLLGAEPSEIALARNASDGIAWVVGALDLGPDDEVVTSDAEGVEVLAALSGLRERTGAAVRFVPLSGDPDRLAADLRGMTTPRTELVLLSHVSCETGVRAPLEVVRSAIGPQPYFVADAAQSAGVIPVQVGELRADAVIGAGHKFLCGPKGTGFAWFSPATIDRVRPLGVDVEAVDPDSRDRAYYQREPMPVARYRPEASLRFEFGTFARHAYAGLTAAIAYQESLGWQAIEQHIRSVTDYAKERLASLPGVCVATPRPWAESAGFVTFLIADTDGRDVAQWLRSEKQVHLRAAYIPDERRYGIRASCAYFTNTADIDCLIEALKSR